MKEALEMWMASSSSIQINKLTALGRMLSSFIYVLENYKLGN